MGWIQDSLERFLAMASSTARNCFSSSSRRVDFFALAADDDDDDEFALLELLAALSAALPLLGPRSDDAGGDRFLAAASTIFCMHSNRKLYPCIV